MGDSDEEYDRRRRDKFRGERNDYDNRRPPPRGYDRGRGNDRRGTHENTWENRGSKRDYYGRDQSNRDRRESFGRGSSPPVKKSRGRDWDSNEPQSWRGGPQESNVLMPVDKSAPAVPTLMSFKDFIIQQEDDIDEVESVRRYQEYKVEFKRTQINDFFVMHKAEEWFKEKYHPTECANRKLAIRKGLRKRLKVFLDLWEAGYMDNVSLHIDHNEAILKLLDRVILKLEGRSDEEIKALDFPPIEEKNEDTEAGGTGGFKKQVDDGSVPDEENKNETDIKLKSYNYDADGGDEDDDEKEPLPPGMEDEEDSLVPPGMEDEEKPTDAEGTIKKEDANGDAEDGAEFKKPEKKYVYDGVHVKRPVSLFMRNVPANITRADLVGVCKRYPGFLRIALSEPSAERRYYRRAWATFDPTVNIKDICWNLSNIRVKDVELNPVVNRDVSNRIRPVNGVSCSPMAAQLDINFAIKLMSKYDERHQLYVKGESNGHSNETLATETEGEDTKPEEKAEEEALDLPEENTVISHLPLNITEYITGLEIEDHEDSVKEYPIVPNEELNKALDLVLLYLRIVHCLDFYNGNEYLHEDEMPVRCGIMHVRGPPLETANKNDVHEWHKQNSAKMEHIFQEVEETATEEEAEKLGKKNEETEVENFIKANTQELAKDKWLCPLSGKKFRGPEFIRKHILMKHPQNVEEVKMEVKFFNCYIYDMKRPCFPEAKPRSGGSAGTSTPQSSTSAVGAVASSGGRTWSSNSRQPVVFATPRPPPYQSNVYREPSTPQPHSTGSETYGRMNTYPPKQRRGGYRDRKVIKYRDLDAPEESDFF